MTGSWAERFAAYKGRAEAVVYASGGQADAADDAPSDVRIDALELYGRRAGPSVLVAGVVEATQHCTFEDPGGGGPVWYLRGPTPKGRLGTLFAADHPVVQARPDLFVPLLLPIDFPWPEQPDPDTPLGMFGQ